MHLSKATDRYFSNFEEVARREVAIRETEKSDSIHVRRDAVSKFIQFTNQVLLWCVESHRYSERRPEEFGLPLQQYRYKGEGFHYVYERMRSPHDDENERPRMSTKTQVYGKRLVML